VAIQALIDTGTDKRSVRRKMARFKESDDQGTAPGDAVGNSQRDKGVGYGQAHAR
jgi:hypothetical protein